VEKIISEWVRCPVCENKTRLQIRADTELKNFPLYCPKCRQESLIDAKNLQVTVIRGFGAKAHS
jgi:cytochrome c-type biogenesis protein CcmH/NrfF